MRGVSKGFFGASNIFRLHLSTVDNSFCERESIFFLNETILVLQQIYLDSKGSWTQVEACANVKIVRVSSRYRRNFAHLRRPLKAKFRIGDSWEGIFGAPGTWLVILEYYAVARCFALRFSKSLPSLSLLEDRISPLAKRSRNGGTDIWKRAMETSNFHPSFSKKKGGRWNVRFRKKKRRRGSKSSEWLDYL